MGDSTRPERVTRRAQHRLRAVFQLPHIRLWLEFFGAAIVVCQLSLALLQPGLRERSILTTANLVSGLVLVVGTASLPEGSRIWRVWPALVTVASLVVVGATTHGLAPAMGGYFTLTFVYVGLTQARWTSLWLVPFAFTGWLLMNRPIGHSTAAKMPVAVGLWILLAELLSRVTAHRAADQARLAEQAARDALTGMRNRHGFDQLLADATTGDALVFLDLDNFKNVNDLLGHDVGDQVIADLGRIVLAVLRPGDVAVRYGGDEVLLLLPGTSCDGAAALIRRMRRGWSASHPELTFSAGISVVGRDGAAAAAKEADDALYIAKQRGRNRSEVYGRRPPFIPGQSGPVDSEAAWPSLS